VPLPNSSREGATPPPSLPPCPLPFLLPAFLIPHADVAEQGGPLSASSQLSGGDEWKGDVQIELLSRKGGGEMMGETTEEREKAGEDVEEEREEGRTGGMEAP